MVLSPNESLFLLSAGFGGIFLELKQPGLTVPGSLGCGAVLAGGYFLWHPVQNRAAVVLVGAAILLFASEAIWNTRWVGSILGTVAVASSLILIQNSPSILQRSLAVLLPAGLGLFIQLLTQSARRARLNKRADL